MKEISYNFPMRLERNNHKTFIFIKRWIRLWLKEEKLARPQTLNTPHSLQRGSPLPPYCLHHLEENESLPARIFFPEEEEWINGKKTNLRWNVCSLILDWWTGYALDFGTGEHCSPTSPYPLADSSNNLKAARWFFQRRMGAVLCPENTTT